MEVRGLALPRKKVLIWGLALVGVTIGLSIAIVHFQVESRYKLYRLSRVVASIDQPQARWNAVKEILRLRTGLGNLPAVSMESVGTDLGLRPDEIGRPTPAWQVVGIEQETKMGLKDSTLLVAGIHATNECVWLFFEGTPASLRQWKVITFHEVPMDPEQATRRLLEQTWNDQSGIHLGSHACGTAAAGMPPPLREF